ncbi:hypothetical protein [Polyangium sp. 6x1]|uniref:hypothetical protein n=1 Tax=Polyangium sp. 6x1 TaxID=3042689 RepID=UPI0024830B35|nr:hypothetical protein [Polyangium sp. 6x1]
MNTLDAGRDAAAAHVEASVRAWFEGAGADAIAGSGGEKEREEKRSGGRSGGERAILGHGAG